MWANIIIVAFIAFIAMCLILWYFEPGKKACENQTIPKIIHQLAPADKAKWHPTWKKCQDSWKRMFPDYKYMLWTDEKMDEFMKTEFPAYYEMYQNYRMHINRVDAVRYFILYKYGGIYADMDMQVFKDFTKILPNHTVSVVESPYKQNEQCQNALMISPKSHPFWLTMFEELRRSTQYKAVLDVAGPRTLDRGMVGQYINVLPYSLFNPNKDHRLTKEEELRLYTRHYGTSVYA